jgi:hypothetical protein
VGVVTNLIPKAPFDPLHTIAMVCGPEVMMRFSAAGTAKARRRHGKHLRVYGAQHEVCDWLLWTLPVRAGFCLPDGPVFTYRSNRKVDQSCGGVTVTSERAPKLAVWKFASCDGCQLSLLDCEDELLAVADAVEIAYFPEATRTQVRGPYDISLVEGSITTAT